MRTYQEMDVGPVSPSSTTTGCEGEWSAFDPLPKLTQASDKDVRIIVGKERESYEPEFNYNQDTRHRVQKWNVGPEHRKERETFCGCFGKRTPFLRLRARLQQDVRHLIQKQKTNQNKKGKTK